MCTVTIIDEILGTKEAFEVPTTVAEAAADCVPVMQARFFLKWFEADELFYIRDDMDIRPEPIGVAIIQKPESLTVVWHDTGLGDPDDARFRREQILAGNWIRPEGVDYDD